MSKETIYNQLLAKQADGKKQIAILLDPDKTALDTLGTLCASLVQAAPDYIFVGGSRVEHAMDGFVRRLKELVSIPIVLFPGSVSQFTPVADAMLFLSLISGRNADYLVEHHVQGACAIHQSGIETIPTGYILVDGGKQCMVQLVSHTTPIAYDDVQKALSTAIAGQLMGHKLIYLEAGSGAMQSVSTAMIAEVKQQLDIPLIVGGGIRSVEQIHDILEAGADLIVVGNHLETHPDQMKYFCDAVRNHN